MVDFSTIINKDDLATLKDDHSCIAAHISNTTARIIYRLIRIAGYNSYLAHRARHWHLRNIIGLIDIADYPNRLNKNER
ncbi:unnamed protein product, partial [marine sediment metagenome]